MVAQAKAHPSRESLRQYILGCLQGEEATQIDRHVESCDVCCDSLTEMSGETDAFIASLTRTTDLSTVSIAAGTTPTQGLDEGLVVGQPLGTKTELVGPYRLLGLLGTGGMGRVFRARHEKLNRLVAIKVLQTERLDDPHYALRFSAEAESVARLQHPNIVQIFDVGRHNGHPYFAMELVDDKSLGEVMSEQKINARQAAKIIQVLATAMHYAHEMGVVHRDLKPANILLDSSNSDGGLSDAVVKIADFGMAKQLDSTSDLTQTGMVAGTPNYMAPEQVRGHGERVGPLTDVFSLGVILVEILTGKTPFYAATQREVMNNILDADPVLPRDLDVPVNLASICMQCLQKEPGRRYASARALADDLGRFLAGEAVAARRPGWGERTWRWTLRRPALTALMATVFLVAVVGFPCMAWLWLDASSARDVAQERDVAQRWANYRANVLAAGSFSQLNNQSAAKRALEASPEEHRDWEWKYYRNELDGARLAMQSDESRLFSFAFRSDGTRVCLLTKKGISLWDPRVGKQIAQISTHSDWDELGGHISFSPDGRLLAVPGRNQTVNVLDGETGQELTVLEGHGGEVTACKYSPNGARLLCCSMQNATASLWDTTTNNRVCRFEVAAEVSDVLFSPDGKFIAIALQDGVMQVRNAETGDFISHWDAHDSIKIAMEFSPDGKRLATGAGYPESLLKLWDLPSGELIATMSDHENSILAVDFSTDEKWIASGAMDRTVRLWDAKTGAAAGKLEHPGPVWDVRFTPDNSVLVTASQDGALRFWDTSNWELISLMQASSSTVLNLEFDEKGNTLASASLDASVSLWEMERCKQGDFLRGHDSFVYDVAFSPDGQRVASAAWDNTFRVWDVASGQESLRLKSVGPIASGVAFDSHRERLVAVDRLALTTWDLKDGTRLMKQDLMKATHPGRRVTISPDGRLIATATNKGDVGIFDASTGESLIVFASAHTAPCSDVAFSPDSRRLISVGYDSLAHVWNMQTLSHEFTLTGHTSYVTAVAYSHSGDLIATCSSDMTVRLWDGQDYSPRGVLDHGVYVYDSAFSPDGKRLAVACDDNYIRLWDVASQDLVAQLHGHKDYVHSVAFSPDGTQLVSGSGDKTLRIWDTLSPSNRKRQEESNSQR